MRCARPGGACSRAGIETFFEKSAISFLLRISSI
jgi:hypothetical protein